MLKSNRIAIILAFVMAVVLWAYVLGEVDPVRTITFKDIPIRLLNESALGDEDLIITDIDSQKTSVTFTAKRSIANKIKADDFNVTANLKGISQGDNIVEVEVTKPSSVSVESISTEFINIKTEKIVTLEKNIEVVFTNDTDEKTEPKILRLSEETVRISGASSLVNRVDRVIAKVDTERLSTDPNSISVKLRAVDSDNNRVKDISFESKNVSVTAILKYLKEVKLTVPVVGKDSGSVSRGVSIPETIVIKGSEEDLSNVGNIVCQQVDVSSLYENKSISLVPILPHGIELSDESQNITMEVAVYNAAEKEFNFTETDINIVGISEKSSVKIHEVKVTVVVKGNSSAVNALTKEDLSLSANASKLSNGTQTVDVEVTTDKADIDLIEVKPNTITIDINK
ncbi:MAG: hypothetical protein IIU36_01955 [Firmicutes bacterium]|nr:hypothetical protein [Bacillota bacterium]